MGVAEERQQYQRSGEAFVDPAHNADQQAAETPAGAGPRVPHRCRRRARPARRSDALITHRYRTGERAPEGDATLVTMSVPSVTARTPKTEIGRLREDTITECAGGPMM